MKILLAERSRAVAAALRRLLEHKGHEVDLVYDGVQALDRLQSERFDLLVVEVDLPRLSGLDLVKSTSLRGVKVPTIGILPSSEVTKEDLIEGSDVEVLLPKPYPADALLSLVDMLSNESEHTPEFSFWQRRLLRLLSEDREVTYAELSALLPSLFGTVYAFLFSLNAILAGNGSGKRIVASEGGYRMVKI